MSFGKGSSTTTQTTGPSAQAMGAYSNLLGRAQGVSQTPYTPYGGELVAGVNQQQNLGIGNINQNAGFAQPFIGQAAQYANNAAQPITGQQIANYQSPYTQQVVDATQRQFNNQNAQQQSALTGNAAAQGALGGDRVGVAQGILAGQQSLAQSPVIAGLYNSGYQNAEQMALSQQQAQGNAAYSLGNLGVAGQGAALQGAGAQVGAGTLQQQTQQGLDAAQLQQFYQQQAYPFQTAQWLAGIDTGVGSQMGGTSTTTPPPPNPWNTALGVGLTAASMFARDGGRIHRDAGGGLGGTPWGGAQGWVPGINITGGSGAPKAPAVPGQQANPLGNLKTDVAAGKGLKNLWNQYGPDTGGPLNLGNTFTPDAIGGTQAIGSAPELGFGFGPIYRDGGAVKHFEDGGLALAGYGTGSVLPFDDRWAAVPQAMEGGQFTPKDSNVMALGAEPAAAEGPKSVATIPVRRPTSIGDAELPPEIRVGSSREPDDAPDDSGVLAYGPGAQGLGAAPPAAAGDQNPSQPASGGLLSRFGVNIDPDLRRSLLSAGFGLMASKSPFLGQAIGEAGMAGMNTYSGIQEEKRKGEKSKADIEHGKNQLAQAAKIAQDRLAAEQKHWTGQLDQSKATLAETTRQHDTQAKHQADVLEESRRQHQMGLKAPVKIGEDRMGTPIMALPRLKDNGDLEYYKINKDGTISDSPMGAPTAPPSPTLSPGVTPGPSSALPSSPGNAAQPTRTAALNTGDIVTDAPPPEVRATMPTASRDARDEQYLAQIAKEDPRYAADLKAIANYQMSPAQFSLRNNRRERAMGDVMMYDPTYDQRRYNQTNRAITGWAQSPEGRATRSLSVTIEHLGTAEELGRALQNGDVRALNTLTNWAKTQFGYEGPVNFEFAKQIVADEIAKAVIGGQNGEGDRRNLQEQISRSSSPEQLAGVVRTAKQLMAGQVLGLQHTYETATGLHNFDSWLTPRAKAEIERAAATHAAPAGGGAATPAAPAPSQVDIDYAKKHPEVREKFIKRFGREP